MANNNAITQTLAKIHLDKLKISKKALIIVGIGALVFLIVGMFGYRNNLLVEQTNLKTELEVVKNRLASLGMEEVYAQQADLSAQIEQVTLTFNETKQPIAVPINSIESSDILFVLARQCEVEIKSISAAKNSTGQMDGVPVVSVPVTVNLQGSWLKLAAYLTYLKTDFPACYVKNVRITISEDESSTPSAATLSLLIYSYWEN